MSREYQKSHRPRVPVKVTRESCLKCGEGPFETEDDMRICPSCTNSNWRGPGLDDTRYSMGSATGGRKKGRS